MDINYEVFIFILSLGFVLNFSGLATELIVYFLSDSEMCTSQSFFSNITYYIPNLIVIVSSYVSSYLLNKKNLSELVSTVFLCYLCIRISLEVIWLVLFFGRGADSCIYEVPNFLMFLCAETVIFFSYIIFISTKRNENPYNEMNSTTYL